MSEEQKFNNCMSTKNPGFRLSMLTLLLIGYAFMVFYIAIIFVMATVGYIKYKQRRGIVNVTSRVLKHIKKTKFSEEKFGKISDENECIICMSSYVKSDTVTQLNCNK